MIKRFLNKIFILTMVAILVSCSSFSSATYESSSRSYNTATWAGNTATTWDNLQHTSSQHLAKMQMEETNPYNKAWIDLALLSKRYSKNTTQLAKELLAWREQHKNHVANNLIPRNDVLQQLIQQPAPKQIAILLPQQGAYASSGRIVREGFLNAYYSNLSNVEKQNIKFYDTSQTKDMALLYQQAIEDGADFVIGPLLKEHVQKLRYSRTFQYPTLALNYTEQRLWGGPPTNFYEFGLLPEDEISQVADKARRTGVSKALIIVPNSAWGKRLLAAFSARWQSSGGSITDTLLFTAQTNFNSAIAQLLNVDPLVDKKLMKENNDKDILQEQRRQDFDVIFLFTQPKQARTIVPLLRYYYANDIPVYASSSIHAGKYDPARDVDLNDVIVCDVPWNMQSLKKGATNSQEERLYAVGQDAYLLSQSLARLAQMPNFPMYGATGALTMTKNHQIHRRLPCIAMQNGRI